MKTPELPPPTELIYEKAGSDLIALMQNTDVNKKLQKINNAYPYWDIFKYKVVQFGIEYDASILWSYNKILRDRIINRIKITEFPNFEFKYNLTNNMQKLMHYFDMHLGGALEGRAIIPPDEKNRYLISSIMEEAIASSQLEGAVTTREDAKQMLRTERKPRTLDEKMILNNYLTIQRVIQLKDVKFSKDLILELHSIITKDTLKDNNNEGKFRTNNEVNVVDDITGEVFYTPPSHEKIEVLISAFCAFANKKQEGVFIHPIIKAIFLHFFIGYLHPFVDGNGRTARALFYWYLISEGYWLVEYMSISKIIIKAPVQYARSYLYTEYDGNDLTYFLDYNLRCMKSALDNLQKYIKRKVMEKGTIYNLIRNENINERQAELLKLMITDHHKGFTVKEVQSRFVTSYPTARTDLLGLVDLGYIEEKKYGKKLMFFKIKNFEDKIMNALNE